MQNTSHHGLKKYETTDQWHLADQNENLDKIDALLAGMSLAPTAGGTATALVLDVAGIESYVTGRRYVFVASTSPVQVSDAGFVCNPGDKLQIYLKVSASGVMGHIQSVSIKGTFPSLGTVSVGA